MALMNEPKMLLLDEPTAGINPTLINSLIHKLKAANKEFGITLLVIEHKHKYSGQETVGLARPV